MIRITSEIGTLKKVIIHTPDNGIEQVTPDKAVEYLYEDIVYLDKMKKEHNVLRKVLERFIGTDNVLDIQNLLEEICSDSEVKQALVHAVARFERNESLVGVLSKLAPASLAYTLITGIQKSTKKQLFAPASNFIFCRDIGTVLNNYLLIAQANKRARSRESLLSWFVYHHSKVFESLQRNNWFTKLSNTTDELLEHIGNDENELSIEGGDVMMFGNDHVFIGCSERTRKYAFEKVKEQLFKRGVVTYVVMIEIPKERYCMHLDTIFTRIDEKTCVAYAPLILEKQKLLVKRYEKGIDEPVVFESVKDLVLNIIPDMQFIPCGGGVTPHQEREQWTDGCNLFAIKPGVAITYDRNKMTTKAIEKAGYTVYKAEKLLAKIYSGEINPATAEKMLILIPSNELSRARGGTHCLTFPLWRD